MFIPPRCPYASCRAHRNPPERFFRREGRYLPRCRPHPVPRFHANRLADARLDGPFMLDELQPVTVPVLIEPRSLFVIASEVGPLRRKGRMTPAQLRRRAAHEALHGRRPSHGAAAVRAVLERLRSCVVLAWREDWGRVALA